MVLPRFKVSRWFLNTLQSPVNLESFSWLVDASVFAWLLPSFYACGVVYWSMAKENAQHERSKLGYTNWARYLGLGLRYVPHYFDSVHSAESSFTCSSSDPTPSAIAELTPSPVSSHCRHWPGNAIPCTLSSVYQSPEA